MSDLISRSELIEEIKSLSIVLNGKQIFPDYAKDTILRIINEQPTAYSIDNVIEELEEKKQNALEVEESIKEYNVWNDAIEIVKLHGKEKNEKYHDGDFDEKER